MACSCAHFKLGRLVWAAKFHAENMLYGGFDAKLHSASKLSMIHHRDIATFLQLALSGALDEKIVNTVDEASMSFFELYGSACNAWFIQKL